MPIDATYFSAFLVGLLGGVHCVGMCGGLVGAFCVSLDSTKGTGLKKSFNFVVAYNAGRLFTYTLMGAGMGALGSALTDWAFATHAQLVLKLIAGLFMVALGFYLSGWWFGLQRVEQMGSVIWRLVEPFGRHWLPIKNIYMAIGVGVVWGWLPCGLVYSVLIWSMSSGGFLEGGLLMFCFGLGTLPLMIGLGMAFARIGRFFRSSNVKIIAGLLVVGFGVYTIVEAAHTLVSK